MVKEGKCAMCGARFVYDADGLPPCTVRFFGKKYYADCCYGCGGKLARFIKSYRSSSKWRCYTS